MTGYTDNQLLILIKVGNHAAPNTPAYRAGKLAEAELRRRERDTVDLADAQDGYAAASAVDTDKLPTVDIGLEWIE